MATDDDVLEVVESSPDPFVSASEVAEEIGVARQTAWNYLENLYSDGELQKKKVGSSAVIWWTE